jgi:hypothetical protein
MTNIVRAASFINSIGVCTHLSYTDGGYRNTGNVIKDLQYLGVSNVRDSLQNASHLAAFQTVAASGVRFTLTVGGGAQTPASLAGVVSLAGAVNMARPGSVVAMEGANEIDHWPVTYNGLRGIDAALAMQRDLYADVHASSALKGVAVAYFTGYGSNGVALGPNPRLVAGLADYNNQHPYPVNGHAPDRYINPANSLPNATGAIGPVIYTETGYSSNGGVKGAVNEDVQAKYTLDLLCDAAKYGVKTTYLYDLMDAYAPGSKQGDDGFGLFDYNNKPKEVAFGIHNLTTLLADTGPHAGDFALGAFNPTVNGLSSTGGVLTMEKSSGAYDLVVWDEPEIWNKALGIEIQASAHPVSVDLGASFSTVNVYDPLVGTSPIMTLHDARLLTLSVTDHPLIVETSNSLTHL